MDELNEIRQKADQLGLEGEDRDDFIEAKMKRLGFKRGPGEWISADDDDSPRDDDDQPITRGEWRRIQREKAKEKAKQTAAPPPKKETEQQGNGKKLRDENDGGAWWR